MYSVLKYLSSEGHCHINRAINFCDSQSRGIHPATLKHPIIGHSLSSACRPTPNHSGGASVGAHPEARARAAQVSANNRGAPRNQSRGVRGPRVWGTPQSRLWEMNCEGTPFSSSSLSDGPSAVTRLQPPLHCILKYWDKLTLRPNLKKQRVIFFCSEVWPQYSLEDGETWPSEGGLHYNTRMQLDLFCRKEGKRSEVPHVQAFFALRDNPDLCKKCQVDRALLAVISCLPSPKESLFKGTPPQGTPSRGTPSEETLPRETPPEETLPRELQRDPPPLLRRTPQQTPIS